MKLLSDGIKSFNNNCLKELKANKKIIDNHLNNSLMLITCLNNKLGYEKCAEIAKKAYKNNSTLKEESIKLGYITDKEFDELVDPKKMCNL